MCPLGGFLVSDANASVRSASVCVKCDVLDSRLCSGIGC